MKCNCYKLKNRKVVIVIEYPNTLEDVFTKQELSTIGNIEFYKVVEIEEDSPLIAADPQEVIKNIREKKYHIQGYEVKMDIKHL